MGHPRIIMFVGHPTQKNMWDLPKWSGMSHFVVFPVGCPMNSVGGPTPKGMSHGTPVGCPIFMGSPMAIPWAVPYPWDVPCGYGMSLEDTVGGPMAMGHPLFLWDVPCDMSHTSSGQLVDRRTWLI